MKQTAVQLFLNDLIKNRMISLNNSQIDYKELEYLIQKYLKIEKEQIKNAYLGGYLEDIPYPTDSKYYDIGAEQYYNETFGETIVTEYRDGTIEVDEFKEE